MSQDMHLKRYQVAKYIVDNFDEGKVMPSIRSISEMCGASIQEVRFAQAILECYGMIEITHGVGVVLLSKNPIYY